MHSLISHLTRIDQTRDNLIGLTTSLNNEQVIFRPASHKWSILEIIEHLVWTEYLTNYQLWKIINPDLTSASTTSSEQPNHQENLGLSDDIPHEDARATMPRWGGSAQYWIKMLNSCGHLSRKLMLLTISKKENTPEHDFATPEKVALERFELVQQHFQDQHGQIKSILGHRSFPA